MAHGWLLRSVVPLLTTRVPGWSIRPTRMPTPLCIMSHVLRELTLVHSARFRMLP